MAHVHVSDFNEYSSRVQQVPALADPRATDASQYLPHLMAAFPEVAAVVASSLDASTPIAAPGGGSVPFFGMDFGVVETSDGSNLVASSTAPLAISFNGARASANYVLLLFKPGEGLVTPSSLGLTATRTTSGVTLAPATGSVDLGAPKLFWLVVG